MNVMPAEAKVLSDVVLAKPYRMSEVSGIIRGDDRRSLALCLRVGTRAACCLRLAFQCEAFRIGARPVSQGALASGLVDLLRSPVHRSLASLPLRHAPEHP
jgi:hypothetical protein